MCCIAVFHPAELLKCHKCNRHFRVHSGLFWFNLGLSALYYCSARLRICYFGKKETERERDEMKERQESYGSWVRQLSIPSIECFQVQQLAVHISVWFACREMVHGLKGGSIIYFHPANVISFKQMSWRGSATDRADCHSAYCGFIGQITNFGSRVADGYIT